MLIWGSWSLPLSFCGGMGFNQSFPCPTQLQCWSCVVLCCHWGCDNRQPSWTLATLVLLNLLVTNLSPYWFVIPQNLTRVGFPLIPIPTPLSLFDVFRILSSYRDSTRLSQSVSVWLKSFRIDRSGMQMDEFARIQVWKNGCMQLSKYASKYASMQVRKHARMQICKQ